MAWRDGITSVLGTAWNVGHTAFVALFPAADGTTEANKPLVVDADKKLDTLDLTELKIGGTAVTATAAELNASVAGVTATAAEINRATDLSARIVNIAIDSAITEVLHEGRTVVLGGAGSSRTMTLPAATGGGGRYRFVVGAVNTSNYVFKSAVGTDLFEGALIMVCDGGDSVEAFEGGATDDTITLNGTTTGGAAVGDWVEFEDISATGWAVRGVLTGTGDEVTPFSDSVA